MTRMCSRRAVKKAGWHRGRQGRAFLTGQVRGGRLEQEPRGVVSLEAEYLV